MEQLELILIKYILGFGLQSFLLVLGIYTFNKEKFHLKNYLITSLVVTLVTFIMKLLPISIGVQTIMNMLFLYLVCVTYLKMHPYITIRSTSFCVVLILLSEMIVTAVTVMFIGQDKFQMIIRDTFQRNYIGTCANIVFAVIIAVFFFMFHRKGEYHRSIGN